MTNKGLRAVLLWGPPLVYMGVIFYASGLSNPPDVGPDVSAHFIEYLVLGALFARAIGGGVRGVQRRVALIAWLGCVLYGASDEFHQSFVPRRQCELKDLWMDSLGGAAGAALLWTLAVRLGQREGGIAS